MARPIDSDEAAEYLMDSFWFDCDDIDVALQAIKLTPTICPKSLCPAREQVKKAWMGEWIGSADGYADGELVYDVWERSECGYVIDEEDNPDMLPQFCPKCYAAMTDKAVDIIMQRLEALSGEANAN